MTKNFMSIAQDSGECSCVGYFIKFSCLNYGGKNAPFQIAELNVMIFRNVIPMLNEGYCICFNQCYLWGVGCGHIYCQSWMLECHLKHFLLPFIAAIFCLAPSNLQI